MGTEILAWFIIMGIMSFVGLFFFMGLIVILELTKGFIKGGK